MRCIDYMNSKKYVCIDLILVPNTSSTSSGMTNESQFDPNGHLRSCEHQRLLHMES
jgi:hypothetical protein